MSVGEEGKALSSQLLAGQLSPQLAGRGVHAVQCSYSTVNSCSVYSVVGEQCRAFQLQGSCLLQTGKRLGKSRHTEKHWEKAQKAVSTVTLGAFLWHTCSLDHPSEGWAEVGPTPA